jgi:hypothetical protein
VTAGGLTWQDEPGHPLRLALAKRYLDVEHAAAKRLAGWLRAEAAIRGAASARRWRLVRDVTSAWPVPIE